MNTIDDRLDALLRSGALKKVGVSYGDLASTSDLVKADDASTSLLGRVFRDLRGGVADAYAAFRGLEALGSANVASYAEREFGPDAASRLREIASRDAAKALAASQSAAAIPQRPIVEEVARAANERGILGALGTAMEDPLGLVAGVALRSLPVAAPAIGVGLAGGGLPAAATTQALTSFSVEFGNALIEEANRRGIDLSSPEAQDAIAKAVADPEFVARARDRGLMRGAIIGLLDGISVGLAGRNLVPAGTLAGRPAARELANLAVAQPAAQIATGAGGEALAQIATEGGITSPGDVLLEAAGEIGGVVPEAAAYSRDRIAPIVQEALASRQAPQPEQPQLTPEQQAAREEMALEEQERQRKVETIRELADNPNWAPPDDAPDTVDRIYTRLVERKMRELNRWPESMPTPPEQPPEGAGKEALAKYERELKAYRRQVDVSYREMVRDVNRAERQQRVFGEPPAETEAQRLLRAERRPEGREIINSPDVGNIPLQGSEQDRLAKLSEVGAAISRAADLMEADRQRVARLEEAANKLGLAPMQGPPERKMPLEAEEDFAQRASRWARNVLGEDALPPPPERPKGRGAEDGLGEYFEQVKRYNDEVIGRVDELTSKAKRSAEGAFKVAGAQRSRIEEEADRAVEAGRVPALRDPQAGVATRLGDAIPTQIPVVGGKPVRIDAYRRGKEKGEADTIYVTPIDPRTGEETGQMFPVAPTELRFVYYNRGPKNEDFARRAKGPGDVPLRMPRQTARVMGVDLTADAEARRGAPQPELGEQVSTVGGYALYARPGPAGYEFLYARANSVGRWYAVPAEQVPNAVRQALAKSRPGFLRDRLPDIEDFERGAGGAGGRRGGGPGGRGGGGGEAERLPERPRFIPGPPRALPEPQRRLAAPAQEAEPTTTEAAPEQAPEPPAGARGQAPEPTAEAQKPAKETATEAPEPVAETHEPEPRPVSEPVRKPRRSKKKSNIVKPEDVSLTAEAIRDRRITSPSELMTAGEIFKFLGERSAAVKAEYKRSSADPKSPAAVAEQLQDMHLRILKVMRDKANRPTAMPDEIVSDRMSELFSAFYDKNGEPVKLKKSELRKFRPVIDEIERIKSLVVSGQMNDGILGALNEIFGPPKLYGDVGFVYEKELPGGAQVTVYSLFAPSMHGADVLGPLTFVRVVGKGWPGIVHWGKKGLRSGPGLDNVVAAARMVAFGLVSRRNHALNAIVGNKKVLHGIPMPEMTDRALEVLTNIDETYKKIKAAVDAAVPPGGSPAERAPQAPRAEQAGQAPEPSAPQQPLAPEPRATQPPSATEPQAAQPQKSEPVTGRLVTPDGGMSVDVTYEVVSLDDLKPATGDLQPRDRTRRGSEEQILAMSRNLDPARLMVSSETDRGAPIVDENMVVLSGNGRTAAIRKAAEEAPDVYRRYVDAISQKFDTRGIERPVLVAVARGLTQDQKVQLARRTLARGDLSLSVSEQAVADARLITDDMLEYLPVDENGDVSPGKMLRFATRLLTKLPPADAAQFRLSDGSVSPSGVRRIMAAILARAYEDQWLVQTLVEDESMLAVRNALTMAAPAWMIMRRGVIDKSYDITDKLVAAIKIIDRSKTVPGGIANAIKQDDMFAARDELAEDVVRLFYNAKMTRMSAQAHIGERLKTYASEAIKVASAPSMFEIPKPGEIVKIILREAARKEERSKGGATLFALPLWPMLQEAGKLAMAAGSWLANRSATIGWLRNAGKQMEDAMRRGDGPSAARIMLSALRRSEHEHARWVAEKIGSKKAIELVVDKLGPRAGTPVEGQTYEEAVETQSNKFAGKWDAIAKEVRAAGVKDEEFVAMLTGVRPAARSVEPLVRRMRELLNEIWGYARDAGLNVGYRTNYFMRLIDPKRVQANYKGFIDKAAELYRRAGLPQEEAKQAADELAHIIMIGEPPTPLAPDGYGRFNAFKRREFGPEADTILAEFYDRNLDTIAIRYITGTVKRAEIARRFGPDFANWKEILREIRDEMREKGADPQAIATLESELSSYVGSVVGLVGHFRAWAVSGGMRLITTLMLMGKATIASLAEPILFASRTGNVFDAMRGFTNTFRALSKRSTPAQLLELAQAAGVIAGGVSDAILAQRWHGADPMTQIERQAMEAFFRRIGLERWTNAERLAAVRVGVDTISRLMNGAQSEKDRNFFLRELGISDIEAVRRWWNRNMTADPIENERILVSARGPEADALRAALHRFVSDVVISARRGDRPRWANTPLGSVIFQFSGYPWAFGRRVIMRQARLISAARKGELSAKAFVGQLAIGFAPAMLALWAATFALEELKDRAYSAFDNSPYYKRLTPSAKIERAASRAGFFAGYDTLYQIATGTRLDIETSRLILGPGPSEYIKTMQAFINLVKNNSPRTNNAERNAVKQVYDTIFEPAVNFALTGAQSPIMKAAASALTVYLLPAGRPLAVDAIAGPKERKRKEEPIKGLIGSIVGG